MITKADLEARLDKITKMLDTSEPMWPGDALVIKVELAAIRKALVEYCTPVVEPTSRYYPWKELQQCIIGTTIWILLFQYLPLFISLFLVVTVIGITGFFNRITGLFKQTFCN